MPKSFIITCLFNFLIAALMGLLLRYMFINPVSINYRYLTHAHSHIAMLGWVYLMLYAFFVQYFISEKKSVYTKLFWLTQVAVLGMMFSFPFQGYAAISISFSTLHIFGSYFFVYRLWQDIQISNPLVKKLVKTALIFMLLSTVGIWCLGPAASTLGPSSAFYQIAIQFFLHFQFNGWFLFAVLAVACFQLQLKPSKNTNLFYYCLTAATLFTFAMPVQWFANHPILYWLNTIGLFLQITALIMVFKIIQTQPKNILKNSRPLARTMYIFAFICFCVKILFQTASIIPVFSASLYTHHNFIIGFIHLTMLGVITGFIWAFLIQSRIFKITPTLRIGFTCFLLGFLCTEALLFMQGTFYLFQWGILPSYHLLLFSTSILLAAGVLLILLSYLQQNFKRKIHI
ncbi:hypothetical protein ACFSQP_01500 [Bizionia sediminis]|uniref:Uncharacterized protein n=1 Tax=Bizionia sediminis TaxID=1737064 RepID=A0ABW5KRV8_9FLAO